MALGKSLGNILGDYFGENPDMHAELQNMENSDQVVVQNIPLKLIQVTKFQTRTHFDQDSLESLAGSIKESGLIHPVLLLKIDDGYILISGERRLRAYEFLGLPTIPSIVREKNSLSDKQQVLLTAVENLQRENLSPLEQSKTYVILMKTRNMKEKDLAEMFNVSLQYISNYLRLLTMSPKVQNALKLRQLTEGQARILVTSSHADQNIFLEKILANNMTVKEIERMVKEFRDPDPKKEQRIAYNHDIPNHIIYQTEIIAKQFKGSKIKFRGNEDKGQITISW
jgi:ParB family transcriptional regulator, chromosome partitioning protein